MKKRTMFNAMTVSFLCIFGVLLVQDALGQAAACEADFTVDPSPPGCAPKTVKFTDNSPYAISWSWSFPGGFPNSATGVGPHNIYYDTHGDYSVTLDIQCRDKSYATITKVISLWYCPSSVGDTVWIDGNQDGIQNSGEVGLKDVTVSLYKSDGSLVVAPTTTDANGKYLFTDLSHGDYFVKFSLLAGYAFSPKDQGSNDTKDSDADPSTGKTDVFSLGSAKNDLKWDAGMYRKIQEPMDFGDAPAFGDPPIKYPTLLLADGARHLMNLEPATGGPPLCLGHFIDAESDGQPNSDADGDDMAGSGDPIVDDEDGIGFLTPLIQGEPATISIFVTGPGGPLNIWIDFNQDHDWFDLNEQIPTVGCPPGATTYTFDIPPDAKPGYTYARFRLSSKGGLSPTGLAQDGEVEDYRIKIEAQPMDFGDAPKSYPTLKAADGARHKMPFPGLPFEAYLGDKPPDREPDGQPNPNATGDDIMGVEDDEDGVKFFSALVPGSPAGVKVTTHCKKALNAWIDFNQDGDWADVGEQIIDDLATSGTGEETITFNVPSDAVPGVTFARFRIATELGLSPTGPAEDGEVEDYPVKIVPEIEPQSDLGDAPDGSNSIGVPMKAYPWGIQANFPTVFKIGSPPYGPKHKAPKKLAHLGPSVSLEYEADIGTDEDGTNNILPLSDGADADGADDGVLMPVLLPNCTKTSFAFTVKAIVDVEQLYVNVWFDWNRDGDWNDIEACNMGMAQEWAVHNQVLTSLAAGMHTFMTSEFLPYHPDGEPKPIWMRITLSDHPWGTVAKESGALERPSFVGVGGSGPSTGYEYGETEDYYFAPLVGNDLDYGDAPAPYPTLGGARHLIELGMHLGAQIDQESNGQPNVNALGDDAFTLDDEDGVIFTSGIIPGGSATVTVSASKDSAYLNAWVDFNADGDWADADEQVFNGQPVYAGDNALAFSVPPSAVPGPTYARFRYSNEKNIGYDGFAKSGEVEDYRVQILDGGKNPIKWNQPPLKVPKWKNDPPNAHRFNGWGVPSVDPMLVVADDWICRDPKPVTGITWWGAYTDWDTIVPPPNAPYAFHIGVWTDMPKWVDTTFSHPRELVKEWIVDRGACGERVVGSHLMGEPDSVFQYNFYIPMADWFLQEGDSTVYWLSIAGLYPELPEKNVWCWLTRDHFFHDDGVFMHFTATPALHDTFKTGQPFMPEWDVSFVLHTTEYSRTFDFGDAPDPKRPTLFESNGALHEIIPAVYLGSGLDNESDGQPDDFAKGDDAAGTDDEDGVTWPSALVSGSVGQFVVTASVPGYLNAWIDFNGDEDWGTEGEQVFTNMRLGAGTTRLRCSVPEDVGASTVFGRFRFSTEQDLSFKGRAIDGEVEDYAIPVEPSGVDNRGGPPEETRLFQNYPNPFNPSTKIEFHLKKAERVKLVIYNLRGQEVTVLCDAPNEAGRHTVVWNGKDKYDRPVSDGLYFCRIEAGSYRQTKKLLLVK